MEKRKITRDKGCLTFFVRLNAGEVGTQSSEKSGLQIQLVPAEKERADNVE